MGQPKRFTNEEIIKAYKDTGSVWKAAKLLGCVGQSVWERLRRLGYQVSHQQWTIDEIEELKQLAPDCTIGEISRRLARSYASVACKASELQVGLRTGVRGPRKVKRGSGLTKSVVAKLISDLARFGGTLRQFSIQHGLDLETFVQAIQQYDAEFWRGYVRQHSELEEHVCPQCMSKFIPMTKKQKTCSRRCSYLRRVDEKYFGGKRTLTVGLAEGVCQLCEQEKKSLSSHHVWGKENDPENELLLAVCRGCHQIITHLGGRKDVERPEFWENLISLAIMRRLGHRQPSGFYITVEIEELTQSDIEELYPEASEEVTA